MDRIQINFVNNLSKDLFVYTQFDECYKCPYLNPFKIPFKTNKTKHYTTHYTLKYAVTDGPLFENSTELCSDKVSVQDQSIHDLRIESATNKCTFVTVEEGRNNLWTLLIVLGILLIGFVLVYLGRFAYKRRRKETSENAELSNKLSQRVNSLDAFRGLTILMMIFVNWGAGGYHFLDHAEWDGLHFADFIFPSFIFIMGTTMAISLKNLVIKKNLPLTSIYTSIVIRSAKLFFVGLVMNSIGQADVRKLRIPGVLQRFSVSYLAVASIHVLSLHISRDKIENKSQSSSSFLDDILPYWPDWILAVFMTIIYFCVTFLWQFNPDCPLGYQGPGGLSENGSYAHCVGGAAGKLDYMVFGEKHIYQDFTGGDLYDPEVNHHRAFNLKYDPEGLLGCTTSIVLTFIGLQVGKIIVTYSGSLDRLLRWTGWALILSGLTAALAATGTVPICKNLWSFTFISATGAAAIAIFSLFYILIDHYKVWPLGHPFHYPGMNAILLYIGHQFTGGVFPFTFIYEEGSHLWPLVQNVTGVLLWLLISVHLAKKNFFFTL